MDRKLIKRTEHQISVLQIIGFIQLQLGVISLVVCSFLSDKPETPSVIAVSFFITMIGFSFAFPSLLADNQGLSTMRIIVFMLTNVICMLLLKIGWSATGLREIGLDQYWMGVIAFVFGAKATQKFFESKMAIPENKTSDEEQEVDYQTPGESPEDIVNKALQLHEKDLKRKYGDLIQTLEPGITVTNQHGLIANLSGEIPADFPTKLFVKTNDGRSIGLPIEAIADEQGQINGGLSYRVNNVDDIGSQGAFGGVVVSKGSDTKFFLTCSHVALAGSSKDLKGYGEFDVTVDIYDGNILKGSGPLRYARRNDHNDTALIGLPENATEWNNELPDSHFFKPAIAIASMKLGDDVAFYSSLRSETIKGVLHKRKSVHPFSLLYGDGSVKTYTELIVVGNNYGGYWSTMSQKGDSGSILYNKNYNPFGLIIGGNSQFTFALPLTRVLEETKIKIHQS